MRAVWPAKLCGEVTIPASKSDLLRALLIASLADGTSRITGRNDCDDVLSLIRCLEQVGVAVTREADGYTVRGGKWNATHSVDCGECGFLSRVLPFVCAAQFEETVITGRGSLLRREQQSLFTVLDRAGITYSRFTWNIPFSVFRSRLKECITIENGDSSQPISGLLIALPTYNQDVDITCYQRDSQGYIEMTKRCMHRFGVSVEHSHNNCIMFHAGQQYVPCEYSCEGDWSGAALLFAACAQRGDVTLRGLKANSLQPDRAILDVLELAGANVRMDEDSVTLLPAQEGRLKPFEYSVQQCPDMAPALAVLAAQCDGVSVIHGLQRLGNKESDRATGIELMLNAFGIQTCREADSLFITGGNPHGGTQIDTQHDHRLAMAAALLGTLCVEPVSLTDTACIAKSYPTFWDDMQRLGYRPPCN